MQDSEQTIGSNDTISTMQNNKNRPIGIFDSGAGGLTVFKSINQIMPQENLVYLGDMARLPYGTKSAKIVCSYAEKAYKFMRDNYGIKCMVLACNTASSVSLNYLRNKYPEFPILGVIEPSADLALETTKTKKIAIVATEATCNSGGYTKYIHSISKNTQVKCYGCPILVTLAEEGWVDSVITQNVIRKYMQNIIDGEYNADSIVLGCTHFPILEQDFSKVLGNRVINPSLKIANHVNRTLLSHNLLASSKLNEGNACFLCTDNPERFRKIAQLVLSRSDIQVQVVNI